MAIDTRNAFTAVDADAGGVVTIPCRGGDHRAHVEGTSFVLDDHDIDSELAFLAFGGPLLPCLVYAAVWLDAFVEDEFLSKWAEAEDGALALRRAREEWYGNYWESWPSEPSAARVLFGPRLQRSLALAIAMKWIDDPSDEVRMDAVRLAVQVRARRGIVTSLASVEAHRRPDALVPAVITAEPQLSPAVRGRLAVSGSWVELELPVEWLWDVWAQERAVVDGRFVLAAGDGRYTSVVWSPTGAADREHVPHIVSTTKA